MRTRKEIEEGYWVQTNAGRTVEGLKLEVLLDIRDLLEKQTPPKTETVTEQTIRVRL